MSKPHLTVEWLLQAGFEEVGCWELSVAGDLAHRLDLPSGSGVYAFAIDGAVQYVGLASQSLRKRLGFYRRPGPTQGTNIRLNKLMRGHIQKGAVVQILVARPADYEWNGLRVKGPEGLEAGLIAEFKLPWNVRGMHGGASREVLRAITGQPGMTELEIAKAVYGPTAVQQQVNQHCRALVEGGEARQTGSGGRSDPFQYYPID